MRFGGFLAWRAAGPPRGHQEGEQPAQVLCRRVKMARGLMGYRLEEFIRERKGSGAQGVGAALLRYLSSEAWHPGFVMLVSHLSDTDKWET